MSSVFLWWIIILLIKIFTTEIPTYGLQLRTTDRIIQGIIYLIMLSFCLIMALKLFKKFKSRRSDVTLILMMYFVFSSMASFLQGFFSVFEFKVREFQVFFTDTAFLFITFANLALSFFIIEVFNKGLDKKKNKIIFAIVSAIVIIANIFLTKNTISSASSIEVLLPMAFSIVVTLWLYFLLIKKSFNLSNRVEGEINKKAFKIIGVSGILLISAYLLLVIEELIDISGLRYLNAISFILGYYFFYKGFVLPMNK